MTRALLALAILATASLLYLCYEARQSRMVMERQAGAVDTLKQAQLISTWEAVDIIKDVYKQIAFYSGNDSIKGAMIERMEGYMGRRGVLAGWRRTEKVNQK